MIRISKLKLIKNILKSLSDFYILFSQYLFTFIFVKYFDKFHVICIIIDMITHYKIEENDYKTMTCRFTIFDTNTHSSCGIYCIYFQFYFVCVVVGSYKMIECRGY